MGTISIHRRATALTAAAFAPFELGAAGRYAGCASAAPTHQLDAASPSGADSTTNQDNQNLLQQLFKVQQIRTARRRTVLGRPWLRTRRSRSCSGCCLEHCAARRACAPQELVPIRRAPRCSSLVRLPSHGELTRRTIASVLRPAQKLRLLRRHFDSPYPARGAPQRTIGCAQMR